MIRRFWTDERAATAIEYGLIAGLISILVVVGATTIGTNLKAHFFAPASNGLS